MNSQIPFGPTGQAVYERTYSRTKPDGSREVWQETVRRVADGNLALVYGPSEDWDESVWEEYNELVEGMGDFSIIPAGRHLWASGVRGRQYLFNCHVSGWSELLSRHFEFEFMRLMEGGGVGANYSSKYLVPYGLPRRALDVHVVCDPAHQDYAEMMASGLLSSEYDSDWAGAYEVEDSREGWASALTDLIDTHMTDETVVHAARVYDVSRVRGKGARLKAFGGTASGPGPLSRMLSETSAVLNRAHSRTGDSAVSHLTPVEAMEIDHAIAECVVSGGVRRSARMAICAWNDPHIEAFLQCKADGMKHWTTNISVEIDNAFIRALDLFPATTSEVEMCNQANHVHRMVVEGMLRNGEPGYWNSEYSNVGEIDTVIATNPCGEIALQPWENCNLGHVNLEAFAPRVKGADFDYEGLARAHELMARFLIRATYGDVNDADQAELLATNRRIGVGHLGVQGFLARRGIRYSEAPAHRTGAGFAALLRDLYETTRSAAREYAFELRIPEPVKVTTVAPTGTIAKLPGVSEGIHPIYGRTFLRRVRYSITDQAQAAAVNAFKAEGFDVETCIYDSSGNTAVITFPTKDRLVVEVEAMGYDPGIVESADQLSLGQMLAFQTMYQAHYADNAVSFTANVPEGLDVEGTMDIIKGWLPYLKGTTIMVDGTREQAPYERISEAEFAQYTLTRVEDSVDEECSTGACPVR